MEDYKSNSHKSKEQPSMPEKKVEKVVTGAVKTKKKNGIQKLSDIFISEDANNVGSYIVMDVLIPAAKKAISDIVTNGIDMLLYGGSGRGSKSNTPGSKVSYRSYYERGNERRDSYLATGRDRFDYDEIVFQTRGDAEAVLIQLDELIDRYKMVSVLELYDAAGISLPPHTAHKYGWTNIQSAKVVPVRDGYVLKLPRPMPLD